MPAMAGQASTRPVLPDAATPTVALTWWLPPPQPPWAYLLLLLRLVDAVTASVAGALAEQSAPAPDPIVTMVDPLVPIEMASAPARSDDARAISKGGPERRRPCGLCGGEGHLACFGGAALPFASTEITTLVVVWWCSSPSSTNQRTKSKPFAMPSWTSSTCRRGA